MYKLDLPIDLKEQAAIERRRRLEKERQARIFNNKHRLIGVDKNALEQQIQDKMFMEEMERKRSEAFAHDMIRNDKISYLLDQRQEHDTRELNRALNEFRALHQQPDGRREWDLQDPDYLKKDKPARVSDEDPRCGPASCQKFDGEDLNAMARLKYQQEQLREWSLQQQHEKNIAKMQDKMANKLYDFKQMELDQRARELQKAEEECRRAINSAVKDYNDALKREQEQRNAIKKMQEQDDNMTEIANAIFSDMLTENPDQAISAFGPQRVVPDRWKGMSPEQIEKIRQEQLRQVEEKKRNEEMDRLENEEFDKRRIIEAKAGIIAERQLERKEKEILKQMVDENKRLDYEQKSHKNYLDKVVYTNEPTAAYFMQFNTSTR
ncbi:RIB43A-like with coiled-coils 2 [Brachionus plicatilis]|uniref:RIB43A-like with coiled-coils 2 n=1 Tax=Brachionus plicatilis TaxID=10195 RepID=A0A3M7SLJ1_BRAPC|nr:RIB43A-like with coiled-coils 2 [Brachionus plicatilis]